MNFSRLSDLIKTHSRVFVLVDTNTKKHCFPLLQAELEPFTLIEIGVGEEFKTIETVSQIWKILIKNEADRYSLLINLGGGVVSDLGGFAAACYKRGIDFVNIPTTLLSMVDAAIGGKTGIDFYGLKNSIGAFAQPLDVIVDTTFLNSLPQRQILSGIAEMIKYGYVCNDSLLNVNLSNYQDYIVTAQLCKTSVVENDLRENGQRKILNFGHTIGHAFESYFNGIDKPITHGEAVAMGMFSALFLSVKKQGLKDDLLNDYKLKYNNLFNSYKVTLEDAEKLVNIVANDKKSSFGKVNFVLLTDVCRPVFDNSVTHSELLEAIMSINEL